MNKLAIRIGKKLKAARERRGLTVEKLAYENGISKGYLSDLENGKKLPSIGMLDRLAKLLLVDIKDMF